MEFKYTEKLIQEDLTDYYINKAKYCINNIFLFRHNWETDLFVLRESGYALEIEIKVTRGDFKSDFKKVDKHMILEKGIVDPKSSTSVYDMETKTWKTTERGPVEITFRPNQFYYAVPFGLISVDEVPPYAGLITIGDGKYSRGVYVQKRAPFLHKTKLNFDTHLCNKFYHYYIAERQKIWKLTQEIEGLKYKLNTLQDKIN